MRITIFAPTVIGYVAWPDALLVRGLATALAEQGHEVRIVEERRNRYFTETLHQAGAAPARRFFDDFPQLQHHTYEARSGTHLLEWVTREIALLDVAVVIAGVNSELVELLASITHSGLARLYVAFGSTLTEAAATLAGFDAVLSPNDPQTVTGWQPLRLTVAAVDRQHLEFLPDDPVLALPREVASAFEHAVANVRGVN